MRVKKPLILSIRNAVSAQIHPRMRGSGRLLFSTAPSLTTAEELPNRGSNPEETLNDPSNAVHLSSTQANEAKGAQTESKHPKIFINSSHERQMSDINPYPNQKKHVQREVPSTYDREALLESSKLEIAAAFQAGDPSKVLASYKRVR